MKKCIHCGAELAPEETVCPACGQAVEEDAAQQTAETAPEAQGEAEAYTCEEETAEQTEEDTCAEDGEAAPEDDAQPEQKKKKSPLGWILGGIAVIAVVAAILIAGKAGAKPEPVMHTNEDGFVSYTATEEQLSDKELALVVANCGGKEMTNKDLNYYYWQQYYTFANNYSMYLSYLLDTSKGLDEQEYSEDETWQQAFLTGATDMFHSITALNLEADEAGFELSQSDEDELAALAENLDAAAANYGMESGLAYLQASFGPKATVEDYTAFIRANLRATRYMQKLIEDMEAGFTDDEISAYYDENADSYEESRVLKVDKPMVNIRHILVMPAEQDEDGNYTEEAWAEAEQKAQALLDEWKAGEATEESFAALATENSEDGGSAANGGLYTDVYPGQMVDAFDEWCFDDARQPGDTGIVKSPYGYHVMYYVSQGEEVFWFETAKGDYKSERSADLEDALREKYPMELTLDNAAIFDVQAEDRAAANAAAAEAEAAQSEDTSGEETQDAASADEQTQDSASN